MPDQPQAPGPIVLKFPGGVNNRDREYALPDGSLRDAVNLDVTRDGGLISRKGLREVVTGDCHSLFAHPNGKFALLVKDGSLSKTTADETITALTAVTGPVVYTLLNDAVHWTDGSTVGQVNADGTVGVWGMSTPPLPVVSAVSSGGLFAGTYQVAMTALHSTGLESGAVDTVSVDVADGGGIQVTTPSANGVRFVLYRTPTNGGKDELRSAQTVDPGATVILGVGNLGKPLESLFATRPLPGQCLVAFKGRLWVASGKVVWFTSEKSPHWLFPNTGFYQFESAVTMLSAAEDGIYVGLYDRVYYLQGSDPFKMTQRPVSSVGAASGTAFDLPYDLFLGDGSFPSKQGAWIDTDGYLCIGKAGGIVVRPTHKQFSAGTTTKGAATYRAYEGLRQIVTALTAETAPTMATDIAVSTVFANGVVLNA